ncbi:MAG: Npt1/Npt2 family nucleotide transporter [Myxococcota bacterium]|nr:Npt1/Npt2 family nucleotide transporter [Myxococcota bacterium]
MHVAEKPVDTQPVKPNKTMIWVLSACSFLVLGSYAIARPSLKALLVDHYGKDAVPYAWIFVAIGVTLTVAIYSRAAARMELKKLYQRAVLWICVVLVIGLLLYHSGLTWAVFLLFVWKDVYIVVLIEMFWTFANSVFQLKTAKWIYGVFLSVGTLGGMAANFSVGGLADQLGTGHAPWLVLPMLLVTAGLISAMPNIKPDERGAEKAPIDFASGFKLVLRTKYLLYLLGIIALIQLALNLVDFQLTAMIESNYPSSEDKTAAFGTVYGYIDAAALCMQLGGGLIISVIGIGGVLGGVPVILLVCLSAFAAIPTVGLISFAFIAGKSMDYSVYRTAKEALYLPLSHRERAQGKAVIDMMIYRVAKASAAALLIALGSFSSSPELLVGISVLAVIGWLWLTARILPLYKQRIADKDMESPRG